MEKHIVNILEVTQITHDVKRFVVEKPVGYTFIPGQATEVAINKPGFTEQKRLFTFTGLNDWPNLEFIIKIYRDHPGVTREMDKLTPGDSIIIHEVWGEISYKGTGVFIAGGAGITPFIAILRYLNKNHMLGENKLLFANKTKSDIILEAEFRALLGNNFHNILSDEKVEGYDYGFITTGIIESYADLNHQNKFYICGPDPMMKAVEKQLHELNIDDKLIIKEGF